MHSIKIVIADDMEPILLYLEKVISEVPEFKVVGKAKNGKELIDLVKKCQPELVITDVEMPECSGIEAIEKLNELGIRTNHILITGNGNSIITTKAKEIGILTVIKKPILDDKKFVEQIKYVLDSENQSERLVEDKKSNVLEIEKENIVMRKIKKIFGSK